MPERRKKKNLKSTRHLASRKPIKKAAKVSPKAAKAAEKAKKASTKAKKPAAEKTAAQDGTIQIYDIAGKSLETLKIDPIFHEGEVNTDVLYQAVLKYQAGQREGTAATKTRGEVRGGGKKPWKQKGTGQARHGSRRSPIWRGGGTTFGPAPRDYSYQIPREIKRSAVVEGVKEKVRGGKLYIFNKLELETPKTKQVAKILSTFKFEKPLFLVEKKTENLVLASRNIPGVGLKTDQEVNALDVLSYKECVMTKGAYSGLVKRLKS